MGTEADIEAFLIYPDR